MKKLLLFSAVLLGAVSASRAGLNVSIGIGLPLPAPVIIGAPAPLPACVPVAPLVVAPPPVVFVPGPGCYGYRHGYFLNHEKETFGASRSSVFTMTNNSAGPKLNIPASRLVGNVSRVVL